MATPLPEDKSPFKRAIEEGLTGQPQEEAESAPAQADSQEGEQANEPEDPFTNGQTNTNSRKLGAKKRGRPIKALELTWEEPLFDRIATGEGYTSAAQAVGVNPRTVQVRRARDPAFRRRFDEAAHVGTRMLELEAARRAYHGTDKPVYQRGVCVGTIKEYSDTLMIFLLKARRPEVYRDNYHEKDSGNFTLNINVETVNPAQLDNSQNTQPTQVFKLDTCAPPTLQPQLPLTEETQANTSGD